MKMLNKSFIVALLSLAALIGCGKRGGGAGGDYADKGAATLDSIYKYYSANGTQLLRENYPFDDQFKATYLNNLDQENKLNPYAFLWPFSGTFSAVSALLESTGEPQFRNMLDSGVLVGLQEYYDTRLVPPAYASYISSAEPSERFYDDNIWLGIDFVDCFQTTKELKYLEKAEMIWKFIESGMDTTLGGGIYWCEQKKESKNTCSNAPGAVYSLKLFQATKDSSYLKQGLSLYQWTKQTLMDTQDGLYFDNISVGGSVDKTKYAYNSGQMIQAAALLHNITQDVGYLADAQRTAESAHQYFMHEFTPANGKPFRLINKGNTWFTAVMFRGFVELYKIDKNSIYVDDFAKSLDYAWEHARDSNGLFSTDLSGETTETVKWLLTQAAMVEMYARMAEISQ